MTKYSFLADHATKPLYHMLQKTPGGTYTTKCHIHKLAFTLLKLYPIYLVVCYFHYINVRFKHFVHITGFNLFALLKCFFSKLILVLTVLLLKTPHCKKMYLYNRYLASTSETVVEILSNTSCLSHVPPAASVEYILLTFKHLEPHSLIRINFKPRSIDVWERIRYFISNFIIDVYTYQCWDIIYDIWWRHQILPMQ